MEPQDPVETYRLALIWAGYNPQSLAPDPVRGRRARSHEAFEAFAQLKVAPEVLAILAQFADISNRQVMEVFESSLDGGGIAIAVPGDLALEILREPEVGEFVKGRVQGLRARARRTRRTDWHNRWLWATVESGMASFPVGHQSDYVEWDVSAEDALKLVRQRTSQQAFRRLRVAA